MDNQEQGMDSSSMGRMQVLDMIAAGKITADEGARLLEALQGVSAKPVKASPSPRIFSGQIVIIRVIDRITGAVTVNLRLPFSLISTARRLGTKVKTNSQHIDLEEVLNTIQANPGESMYRIDGENEIIEIMIE